MKKGWIIATIVVFAGALGTAGYLMFGTQHESETDQAVENDTNANEELNREVPEMDNYKYDDVAEESDYNSNRETTIIKEKPSTSISYAPKVYTIYDVDVQPSYPGGMSALTKFIQENQQITPAAYADGTSGTVILEFDVKADGSLDQYDVVQTPGAGLGVEAVRIFQIMPNWNPGKIGNQNVAVRTSIQVPFKQQVVVESAKDSKYF